MCELRNQPSNVDALVTEQKVAAMFQRQAQKTCSKLLAHYALAWPEETILVHVYLHNAWATMPNQRLPACSKQLAAHAACICACLVREQCDQAAVH